mmetsp:Transcript_27626/g.75246  ORF Transcript_27626/g.75246 Transcript_27626/m.75246 type:complete len:239 (+) Transcript_27626:482-1198(+)
MPRESILHPDRWSTLSLEWRTNGASSLTPADWSNGFSEMSSSMRLSLRQTMPSISISIPPASSRFWLRSSTVIRDPTELPMSCWARRATSSERTCLPMSVNTASGSSCASTTPVLNDVTLVLNDAILLSQLPAELLTTLPELTTLLDPTATLSCGRLLPLPGKLLFVCGGLIFFDGGFPPAPTPKFTPSLFPPLAPPAGPAPSSSSPIPPLIIIFVPTLTALVPCRCGTPKLASILDE